MKSIPIWRNAAAWLLMAIGAWSCGPVTPGMPSRKKLPGDESYMLIPLPDAADDSATMSMVNMYKPMAVPLLTQWAQQQQTGVMIDLRADESQPPIRAEYIVRRQNAFSIPVIFIWDRQSSVRAAGFMNVLETFSAVNASRIDGGNLDNGQGNCFQP